jgi:DNA modification methylase
MKSEKSKTVGANEIFGAGHNSTIDWVDWHPGIKPELIDVSLLKPNPYPTRICSEAQIMKSAGYIETFSQFRPVIINRNNEVLEDDSYPEALKRLGIQKCFVVRVEHHSQARERALSIGLSKIPEHAKWDEKALKVEFEYLLEADLDFEIEVTGFETVEIDTLLIGGSASDETLANPDDQVGAVDPDAKAISKPGDLWHLGEHSLLCGNSLEEESFDTLMDGELADMVFADDPYNLKIQDNAAGSGKIKYREFAHASGELSSKGFIDFLTRVFLYLVSFTTDGSIHYHCMDWRHVMEISLAGNAAYTELKNICVWNKSNGGQGSFYRNKYENIYVFKSGTAKHTNNFGLGENGRYRTNVWDYPSLSALGPNRLEQLAMHPTLKPVAMIMDAIRDCSHRGQIILDPFSGAGTTLIAAEKTGRHARCIEIDAVYVDTTIRRWQKLTGEEAIHAKLNRTFEDIETNGREDTSNAPRARNRERKVRHG